MQYRPVADRQPDSQYRDLLARILTSGVRVPTRQGKPALTLMQQTTRYDLANGFPLIPDRNVKVFWRKAIGELCAFINGVTTLTELEKYGCDWWGPWATPEKTAKRGLAPGELGPGSYGAAFHDFPTVEGPPFDQFQHLVEQIRELPELRTHFVSPWIPQYQVRGTGKRPRTTIAPCHGWVHVRVLDIERDDRPEPDRELHLHMYQRSGDVPVGVPSNMIQYAALTLMLEHLTGVPATTFYHTISDAHIYADQVEHAEVMVAREPRRLPTVLLTEAVRKVKSIHEFRPEHFELSDYDPHPGIPRIPVSP
jgi:thymidylate synthase